MFILSNCFPNPVFNCSNNLLLSSVTTGTYNFVPFVSNSAFVGLLTVVTAGSASESASLVALLVITQFSDQVKIRFISQLINGIPRLSKNNLNVLMVQ